MGEIMKFPNTFKEFAEKYKTVDTKEVYSNGIEYIPIFRVEQWLEYISAVEMATFKSVIDSLEQQLKTAKAEAYKECIEKAKGEIDSQSHSRSLEASGERFRIHKILDNLLKELVGDK